MTLRAEQTALSLEDLRLVAALGHAGSLAGAARRIAVNHASAWRRLGALEQRLGVRLFERSRTGYSPTPAGEEAIAVAERVVLQLDDLARRLKGQDVRADRAGWSRGAPAQWHRDRRLRHASLCGAATQS